MHLLSLYARSTAHRKPCWFDDGCFGIWPDSVGPDFAPTLITPQQPFYLQFLNSPSREFSDGIVQRLRKQSIYSCRRARRAGGPICTLGIGKSTFDCGLVRTSSLDRSTQRTQLPQNGTFLLVRRATGRVPDAGNHVNRWFFAGRVHRRIGCKNLTTDLRGLHANSSRCHGPGPFFFLACLHIGSQRG